MIRRWFLIIAGWLALVLGVIGIFLPVLPTTPFVILAATCFAKSSERFHDWLLSNSMFGPMLKQWNEEKTVRRVVKLRSLVLIIASFGFSIYVVPLVWVKWMLVCLGLVCFVMVYRLPEPKPTAK